MELSKVDNDLKDTWEIAILDVIGIVIFILIAHPWNIFIMNILAVIECVLIGTLGIILTLLDWIYLGRRIILDEAGCTFVVNGKTKKYAWKELHILYTKNTFCFGDSEPQGEGIIISVNPISKSEKISAITYCRSKHPATSVFIRFSTFDVELKRKKIAGKRVYMGYIADKETVFSFLPSEMISNSK